MLKQIVIGQVDPVPAAKPNQHFPVAMFRADDIADNQSTARP
jgi:hypothetical protein